MVNAQTNHDNATVHPKISHKVGKVDSVLQRKVPGLVTPGRNFHETQIFTQMKKNPTFDHVSAKLERNSMTGNVKNSSIFKGCTSPGFISITYFE